MDTDRIIAMLGEHGAKADRRRNYGDGVPSHTAMLMGEAIALIRKLSGSHGEPCQHCDDTGDVHGVDGEWRGVCSCPAGKRMVSNNFLRIAIEAYDDVFDGFPESREAAMRAALEAVYAVQDCPAQTHPATGSGGDDQRDSLVGALLDEWQFKTDSGLVYEMRKDGIGNRLDALLAYMDDPEERAHPAPADGDAGES